MRELIVPSRFRGPRSSGNGGWTAGALAALVDHDVPDDHAARWPTIAVSLRKPPPLDTPLRVSDDGGETVAALDGDTVARAEVLHEAPTPVDPVPADEARAAMASYPGLRQHPFPACFSCGTEREEGDGLRIFPGPVTASGGPTRVAATWTPHPSLFEDWHAYHDDHPRASPTTTCSWPIRGSVCTRAVIRASTIIRSSRSPAQPPTQSSAAQATGNEARGWSSW